MDSNSSAGESQVPRSLISSVSALTADIVSLKGCMSSPYCGWEGKCCSQGKWDTPHLVSWAFLGTSRAQEVPSQGCRVMSTSVELN